MMLVYPLDQRLIGCRKLHEKRLNRALNNVEVTIGKLNSQIKFLLVDLSREADRHSKLIDVNRDRIQPYNDFCYLLQNLGAEGKRKIRPLALEKFWEHLNQWRDPLPDLDNKVGNAEDPGDGLLYKAEHVNWANKLLKELHQAWTNMDDSSSHPPPANLVKMGKICLILTGMGQPQLLECFLDHNVCDSDLHLSRNKLENILKEDDRKFVGIFLAEQYRAEQREWHDGHHVEMADEEPLPLIYDKPYREGSYGTVTRVRDPSTHRWYALKQQIIGPIASGNEQARKHLQDERDRLRGLEHKHVVRLVKSYERANSFGLLLEPAATTDLLRLLDRFHKNNFSAKEACNDQEWLRPIFMTAFGCLSHGLAYIHGKDIRHKDIKPDNILYEKEIRQNEGARFLWTDFGLAYDFSASGNSKTHSTKLYSKRYAAPEILKASINPERSSSVMSLDRIVEHGSASQTVEAEQPEEKIMSVYVEDEETSHGRKTDIFSLGCVYMEILAVMVHERLPMDRDNRSSIRRHNANEIRLPDGGRIAAAPIATDSNMFCKHIPQLKNWAQSHSNLCRQSIDHHLTALAPLFDLAIRMISLKAHDRPLINEVVSSVASHGKHYFCKTCWVELSPEEKVPPFPPATKEKPVRPKVKPKRSSTANRDCLDSPNANESTKSFFRRSTAILHIESPDSAKPMRRIATIQSNGTS